MEGYRYFPTWSPFKANIVVLFLNIILSVLTLGGAVYLILVFPDYIDFYQVIIYLFTPSIFSFVFHFFPFMRQIAVFRTLFGILIQIHMGIAFTLTLYLTFVLNLDPIVGIPFYSPSFIIGITLLWMLQAEEMACERKNMFILAYERAKYELMI